MMLAVDCIIRHAVDSDAGLIFDSWIAGAYEVSPADLIPRERFLPHQREHIRRCLTRGTTLVAVHPDDPEAIMGYLCHEQIRGVLIVHWAYVKRIFRRSGIGAHLLEAAQPGAADRPIVFTQASRHLPWLAERLTLAFDPYLVDEAA